MLFVIFYVGNKEGSNFMPIKTSKKKIACLRFVLFVLFYAFYAFYAHRLFLFCAFCAFYAFLCVWNLFVKENKTTLIPSFILLIRVHPITNTNVFYKSFSIITIFFNFCTTCKTIFMKISQRMNLII